MASCCCDIIEDMKEKTDKKKKKSVTRKDINQIAFKIVESAAGEAINKNPKK